MTWGALRAATYASITPRPSGSSDGRRTRSAPIPGRGSGWMAAWPGRRNATTMTSARTQAPAMNHGIVFIYSRVNCARNSRPCKTAAITDPTPAALARSGRGREFTRAVGFDDRAILQITLIAAWFNYINRVADALGVGRD